MTNKRNDSMKNKKTIIFILLVIAKSNLWDRNKYYEYIMKEFTEIKDDETIPIDREDIY